jgi:hypothetical protein
MRAAADAEDKTEKLWSRPARSRRRASSTARCCSKWSVKEALAAFEGTKDEEPNRFRARRGPIGGHTCC